MYFFAVFDLYHTVFRYFMGCQFRFSQRKRPFDPECATKDPVSAILRRPGELPKGGRRRHGGQASAGT